MRDLFLRFEEPRACSPKDTTVVSKLAHKGEPFYLRFIFRYRPRGARFLASSSPRRSRFAYVPSLDLLRAQGIIPPDAPAAGPITGATPVSGRKRRADRSEPDPSPEAGPSRKRAKITAAAAADRPYIDVDGLDDEDALEAELKTIQARSRAIQEKLRAKAGAASGARVKSEDGVDLTGSGGPGGRVKRERSPIRLRTSGEVIDLTVD